MILLKQTSLFTEDELTSFRAASPANPSPPLEKKRGPGTADTFGRKCSVLYEKYAPAGSWARTYMDLLIGTGEWYSTRCALTWKMKASQSSRLFSRLVHKTHRTEGIGSLLLPTPSASEIKDYNVNWDSLAKADKGGRVMRRLVTMMLPTPTASDNRDRGGPGSGAVLRRAEIGKTISLSMVWDGPLNPQFVGQMMGFPKDWTELPFLPGRKSPSKPTETQ